VGADSISVSISLDKDNIANETGDETGEEQKQEADLAPVGTNESKVAI
jgi:hypothetical protein